jgi:hypothetical protein
VANKGKIKAETRRAIDAPRRNSASNSKTKVDGTPSALMIVTKKVALNQRESFRV